MGKNNLDKAVKEKLYDLNTPIDTGDLWSGIQSKMDSENPKPKPTFSFRKYLGLGLLAFMLLGSTYLIYNQFGSSSLDENLTSSVDINKVDNKKVDNISVNVGTASDNTSNKKSSLLTTELNNENLNKNENLSASANSNANTSASANSTESENSNENENEKKSRLGSNANKNYSELTDSYSGANLTGNTKNTANQNNNEQISTNPPSTSSNSLSENAGNIYGSDKSKTSELNTTDKNNASADTEKRFQNALINAINRLDRKENTGISFGRDALDICSMKDNIDCYDAWTKDNKFSIVPYVGVDFVTNDRIRTDSFANYLQERENTMRFLEVIKAGLLVKYNVTPNLYVKVGAQYDQIREVFESTSVDAIEEVVLDAIIGYRITVEGDTIPVTGLSTQTKVVTTQWRKYNKYHSFNIPIILGFQAPIGNGWAYFTEAGIFYNVRFTYEGTLQDQDGMVVSGENYYLNNIGMSLYGALGISYNFNSKLAAFATGSYRYNLEAINNADFNPIKQNLGLAGVSLGLEIRL